MLNLTKICIVLIPLTLVACTPKVAPIQSSTVVQLKVKETVKPKKIIKVMVIDTGIGPHGMLKDLVKYDKSEDYIDNHGHGTHVAGIVAYGSNMWTMGHGPEDLSDKLCDNVEIHSCKYYDPKNPGDYLEQTVLCIEKAIREGMDYINYSGGGTEYSQSEYDAYKKFTINGGILVAAAGNNAQDLSLFRYYPASYGIARKDQPALKNVVIVENVDSAGKRVPSSNWYSGAVSHLGYSVFSFLPNDSAGYMTGTSQAAPGVLHDMLKKRCTEINK